MKNVGIGLLGFGTIGAGVVMALQKNRVLIERRTGLSLELKRIADLDLKRDRGVHVPEGILIGDAEAVVRDPAVDIVVELIGGTAAARQAITSALQLGKPVVTANKALLAEHGAEIFGLAESRNADLFFEASVGGGIPIIRSLREGMISNHIKSMHGILNGTCNYILTRMEQQRLSFAAALKEAQKHGYAEADPALDIDGVDTAHKAVILASLAYGFNVPMEQVPVAGIRGIDAMDIRYAQELGYRIKMLAVIKDGDDGVVVRVHPALVPVSHIMASVSGVFNAVLIEGDEVGPVLYYGKGAGRDPTASAVMGDIVDAARNLVCRSMRRSPGFVAYNRNGTVKTGDAIEDRYYLRLTLLDKPGVFGQVASVLGRYGVSIASVLQKENSAGRHVPVVMIIHHGTDRAVRNAMLELDRLAVVGAQTACLRIEDFN